MLLQLAIHDAKELLNALINSDVLATLDQPLPGPADTPCLSCSEPSAPIRCGFEASWMGLTIASLEHVGGLKIWARKSAGSLRSPL